MLRESPHMYLEFVATVLALAFVARCIYLLGITSESFCLRHAPNNEVGSLLANRASTLTIETCRDHGARG